MNWININPPVSRSLFSSCSFEFWSELTKARKLQLQNELFAIMDGFSQDWPHLTRTDNGLQMDQLVGDLHGDEGFEPQQRGRSNTWPCPRPENFVEPNDELDSTKASNQQLATCGKLGHIYIYSYIYLCYGPNVLTRLPASHTERECGQKELIPSQCMGQSVLCRSHHARHRLSDGQAFNAKSNLRVDGSECAIL